MAEKFLLKDMPLRMNECGPDGFLCPHIWFNYLQHIAAEHAENMGFGISAVKEKGLIWVLSRIKLHFTDYPRYDEVLRIKTYHNGCEKLFAKRQFTVTSAGDGRELLRGSSFWLTLETPALRLRPPTKMLGDAAMENCDMPEHFSFLDKITSPGEVGMEMRHHVYASCVDLNDHLNNTFYSAYTFDWLCRKVGRLVKFRDIQVNYNQSMPLGSELSVAGRLTGENGFYVEGTDVAGNRNSFQAQGTFE